MEENDAVEINVNGRKLIAPVLMVPGHPDGAITVHLGLRPQRGGGPRGRGRWLQCVHCCAPRMRRCMRRAATADEGSAAATTSASPRCTTSSIAAASRSMIWRSRSRTRTATYSLAGHEAMERAIIRYATLDEVKKNPNFAHEGEATQDSLVNKVGYAPEGETPEHDESFFPDAWRYDHKDVSSQQDAEHVGHGDRPELLHRLQRLHRELLCGEQHSGGWPRAGEDRPQHAVAAHRHLLRGRSACAAGALPADGLPALRERGLRAGVPGGRDGAYARGPEHDGLQPLRGHALLLATTARTRCGGSTSCCTRTTTRRA